MLQYHTQGTFKRAGKSFFSDITSAVGWFTTSNSVVSFSSGTFLAANSGCACLAAASGGLVSQAVGITVFPPTPVCTPCPLQVGPTPSSS